MPRDNDDDIVRGVVLGKIGADGVAIEGADALGGTENVTSQRMIAEMGKVEQIVTTIFGVVLAHVDFFQYDALFALDIVVGERRSKQKIGQDVEAGFDMLVRGNRIISRNIAGSKRIDLYAEALHLFGNIECRTALGAFEHHVFDKMRNPVLVFRLVRAPGADINADGNTSCIWHRVNGKTQSTRKSDQFVHTIVPK